MKRVVIPSVCIFLAVITVALLAFFGVLAPKPIIQRFIETDCAWHSSDFNIEIFDNSKLKSTFKNDKEYNDFINSNVAVLDHVKLGKCKLNNTEIPIALAFGTSGNNSSAVVFITKYTITDGKLIIPDDSSEKVFSGNAKYTFTKRQFVIKDIFVFNNFGDDKLTTTKSITLDRK